MIIVLLIVAGLSLGSFVNALIWRVYRQQLITDKSKLSEADKKQLHELSIVHGRSMCMNCGHELAAKDLVPVLSWLSLGGKCRYCGARIPDTPLAELLVPLLFVISYLFWPFVLTGWGIAVFVVWLAAVVVLVALALYDLRWFILPNRLVVPLTAISVMFVGLIAVQEQSWVLLWYPVLATAIIFGLFWGIYQVSNGSWIGGGDVKLAVALGLLAGSPLRALLVIFIASLIGTLVGIPQLFGSKSGQRTIPFGPPLIIATCIVVVFGGSIVSWYQGLLY